MTPIYDLGDDDFKSEKNEDPLQVSRSDLFEAYNVWRLECSDRNNAYNLTTVESRDQSVIELVAQITGTNGMRIAPTVTAREICDVDVASLSGQLMLQRAVYIRNTYKFRLSWEYCLLDPMDLVTVTDSILGLAKAPIRITEIEEDDNGFLQVTAEEFPLGVATATLYPTQSATSNLIKSWPMFANDRYGDCVWAGAAHETMLLAKEAGKAVTFTDADVLSDYAAVTGFDPANPSTDQGTDLQVAASYRRKTGIVDATGKRHTIAAFLSVDPANTQHILLAAYMFVCGVGLQLPSSALDQVDKGQIWDVVAGSSIEGGHYVPLIGRQDDLLVFVSWGRVQYATQRFLTTYCDEAVAYLSKEDLVNQKSADGFDYATLSVDLKQLA